MSRIYTCFKDGKYKAVTFSYDDGKVMDRRLVELFDKYHLKATFHLNSGMLGESVGHQYPYIDELELNELYKNHEVASHTCTHPTLSRIPKEQVIQEALEDRKKLESLTHKLVKGFSYPNGVYNDEIESILKTCGIVYSRTTHNTLRFDIPNNYLHWHPTCHHRDALSLVDQFVNTKYDQRLMLFYIWGHSYEFDRDQNWELIEELSDKISFQDDVWYATNIEIYNYLKAASLLEYTSNATYVYNPSYMSVWLNIDGDIKEITGGSYVCLIKYLDKDLIEYKKHKKPKSVGNPYHYMGLPIGDMRDNMGCINIDLSKDIQTSHHQLENVSFYAYNPLTLDNNCPCIFYIHGGGFIGGSTKTLENPCKYLSEKNQCLVINIDYRLAPENPYPIPMNDCLDVINYVYNESSFIFDRKKIFIAGDSAGGNLALACLIKDYEIHQYKRFVGGMIYYPVVDITSKQEYWQYDERLFNGYKDEMVKACYESLKGLEDMIDQLYVQGKEELDNPYLSPLYLDDFTIFPDLLVMYAEYDYLRLQTEAFVKKAKMSGINVEDYCFLGINHAFVDLLGIVKQSQKSLDVVSQFIEKRK